MTGIITLPYFCRDCSVPGPFLGELRELYQTGAFGLSSPKPLPQYIAIRQSTSAVFTAAVVSEAKEATSRCTQVFFQRFPPREGVHGGDDRDQPMSTCSIVLNVGLFCLSVPLSWLFTNHAPQTTKQLSRLVRSTRSFRGLRAFTSPRLTHEFSKMLHTRHKIEATTLLHSDDWCHKCRSRCRSQNPGGPVSCVSMPAVNGHGADNSAAPLVHEEYTLGDVAREMLLVDVVGRSEAGDGFVVPSCASAVVVGVFC